MTSLGLEAASGFVAGLVSSVPMLGPVVLLLFASGLAGGLRAGRMLAVGAALAEGVHVTLAAVGIGPLLLSEPGIAVGARVGSGLVLLVLALIAWRARVDPDRPSARALPESRAAALGLGVLLVLPNPGFLVVWVAIVSWLAAESVVVAPGWAFVAGAIVGVGSWFMIVLAIARRIGPRWHERHGLTVRRVLACGLGGFGIWALVGAVTHL